MYQEEKERKKNNQIHIKSLAGYELHAKIGSTVVVETIISSLKSVDIFYYHGWRAKDSSNRLHTNCLSYSVSLNAVYTYFR